MAQSDAERARTYRDRKRAEDEYVRRELAVTAAMYPGNSERLERSERYLRWRFQAHARGEVAYL